MIPHPSLLRRFLLATQLGVFILMASSPAIAEALQLDFSEEKALENQWETFFSSGPVELERIYSTEGDPLLRKSGGGEVSLRPLKWNPDESIQSISVTFRSLPLQNAGSIGIWLGDDAATNSGILGMIRIVSPDEVDMRIYPPTSPREIRTSEPESHQFRTSRPIHKQEYLTVRLAYKSEGTKKLLELSLFSARTGEVLASLSRETGADLFQRIPFAGVRIAGQTFLLQEFSTIAAIP
jgi:hypothetical protein